MVETMEDETTQDYEHLLLSILATPSLSSFQEAVLASKAEKGRAAFASLNAVSRLLPLFSKFLEPSSPHKDPEPLLLLLKLLRNLCAGEPSNQRALLDGHGVQAVASLLQNLVTHLKSEMGPGEAESQNSSIELLQMGVQLLGNFAAGGEACAEAIWKEFYPSLLSELATIEQEKVLGPLSMILYFCCQGDKSRLKILCFNERHPPLIRALFHSAVNTGVPGHWLQLLVSDACLFQPFLPLLFEALEVASPQEGSGDTFSSEQAFLLQMLFLKLSEEFEALSGKFDFDMPVAAESISFIVEIIRRVSVCAKQEYNLPKKLPTGIPSVDVLGYAIGITRILSTWESNSEIIVDQLSSHGMINMCLKLLKELGPPKLIRKVMQRQNNKSTVPNDTSAHASDTEQSVTSSVLYEGYRRDLIAIIGNAAYRNKQVQDEVRQMGGLSLVLQQCVVDGKNPFLREWGFWAVRNLLEGNEENQREVMDLELQEPFTPSELAQIGLKVEINQQTRRPRLVNLSP